MIMNCNRRLNRKIITRFLCIFFFLHRVKSRHYKLWPEIIDLVEGGGQQKGAGRMWVIKQSKSIIVKCSNKLTNKFI